MITTRKAETRKIATAVTTLKGWMVVEYSAMKHPGTRSSHRVNEIETMDRTCIPFTVLLLTTTWNLIFKMHASGAFVMH